MKPETETALRESIAKWQKNSRVRNLGNAKVYSKDCPLCDLFNSEVNYLICQGCPVSQKVLERGCMMTPWERAYDAFAIKDLPAFRTAAKAEVAFLTSLLPEKHNDE